MRNPEDKLVKCPFYKADLVNGVCCEGVVEGATTHVILRNGDRKKAHKQRLCRNRWQECPLAKALNGKYNV